MPLAETGDGLEHGFDPGLFKYFPLDFDQAYLNQWPTLFGDDVHVLRATHRTLAPWNARHFAALSAEPLQPVLYHFHGFRIVGRRRARLYRDYTIDPAARRFYDAYLAAMARALDALSEAGIDAPLQTLPAERFGWLRHIERRLRGTEPFARIR